MADDIPPTIYIVDDDADIRASLRMFLEEESYPVREAVDGVDGTDQLRVAAAPVVVLLDLMMPRLDGVGVLRMVAAEPDILGRHAFIVVTANRHLLPGDVQRFLAQQHAPIIPKPFDLVQVLTAVEDAAAHLA